MRGFSSARASHPVRADDQLPNHRPEPQTAKVAVSDEFLLRSWAHISTEQLRQLTLHPSKDEQKLRRWPEVLAARKRTLALRERAEASQANDRSAL